ncbi:hypothetical protein V6N13_111117 [Hibiscus sabdariffa]
MATSAECPIFQDGDEDLDHILRFCPTTRDLWKQTLDSSRYAGFFDKAFDVWLMDNLSYSSWFVGDRMEWGACFSIWCWLLWKLRCSRILDEDFFEWEGLYDKGCRLLAECEFTFGSNAAAPVMEPHCRQWLVGPAPGWVKLNVDAAVCTADGRASVGGVIRDDMGE